MKISEFIVKLKEYQRKYGDIQVLDDQVRVVSTKELEFYKDGENPF